MSRMSLLFRVVAGLEAVSLVVMLLTLLRTSSQNDGGREMGLFFFVLVPAAVLIAAMLVHAFVDSPVARGIALFVVAVPGFVFVGDRLRDRAVDARVADQRSGAGYFEGAGLRDMGRAVVRRDLEAVRRVGPTVDVNASGLRGMTLMQLAVEGVACPGAGTTCARGNDALPIVNALLAIGAKPDPAMPLAVRGDPPALLETLLAAGADPRGASADGEPLVFDWIATMTPVALRRLIDHGLDPDVRSRGDPLAVQVTIHRHWDLLAVLIAAGADTRATRHDGRDVARELATQIANEIEGGRSVPSGLLEATALMTRSATTGARP